MKKGIVLLAFLVSASAYCNDIPAPFWYNLSGKILSKSQQWIGTKEATSKTHGKAQPLKSKVLKIRSKYQQKAELVLPDYLQQLPDYLDTSRNVSFLPE